MMKPINLTKSKFLTKISNFESTPSEWKYLGDKPALIDFYALWCGPCKMIAPILDELATEYDGKIYIYKVDTEEEHDLASAFNIRSIPSLLFVPLNGAPSMIQGAMSKAQLVGKIKQLLGV